MLDSGKSNRLLLLFYKLLVALKRVYSKCLGKFINAQSLPAAKLRCTSLPFKDSLQQWSSHPVFPKGEMRKICNQLLSTTPPATLHIHSSKTQSTFAPGWFSVRLYLILTQGHSGRKVNDSQGALSDPLRAVPGETSAQCSGVIPTIIQEQLSRSSAWGGLLPRAVRSCMECRGKAVLDGIGNKGRKRKRLRWLEAWKNPQENRYWKKVLKRTRFV